jgi:hypothetical protein
MKTITIRALLADAAESLRAAERKLDKALDADNGLDERFYLDMVEAGANAAIFSQMLASWARPAPALSPRIFSAIRNWRNGYGKNTPHSEGGILALKLAERRLESALALCDEHAIDDGYTVAFAARGVVRSYVGLLESPIVRFDGDKAVNAILAAKPMRPLRSRCAHRAWKGAISNE